MEPTILFQEPGVTIVFDPVAHTLAPYWHSERPDGTNYGFVDLRDRPELVDSIPEVRADPALRSLIAALNRTGRASCRSGATHHESDWRHGARSRRDQVFPKCWDASRHLYRFNGESSPTFDRVIDVLQGLNMHLMVKPRK